MKSVLISIQPKWVEKIASGEKTIEVRKSRPKLETPFKCYIYCTIGNGIKRDYLVPSGIQCGKVIGEFICDKTIKYECSSDGFGELATTCGTCLTYDEILNYCNGNDLYGWRISDLKIYDKPKELSEFKKAGFMTENQWLYNLYPNTHCHYEAWAKRFEIKSPPQSWCCVEEQSND